MKKALAEFGHIMSVVPPFVFTLFVMSVVGMNLLANKSINTGVEWLALDCGILFSGVAFLSMDILTHCYGPRAATAASIAALGCNLMMALFFFVASRIPGVWGESFVDGSEAVINTALDGTFGGTWFIILGSSVAFIVSAVLNNFLNWGIGERLQGDKGFGAFALRSYVSTFVAQFTDNMVFALMVSRVFFGWTMVQCITCALTGACLELLFEVFFSPIGYRVSRKIIGQKTAAKGSAPIATPNQGV